MSPRKNESFEYDTKIISPDDISYKQTGNEQITVNIVDDATLEHDEKRVTLRPDTLALNGLLLLRHRGWVRHAEVKDVVGFSLGSAALTTRLHKLSSAIEEITDFSEAVETRGNSQSANVRLSPLLGFNDVRESSDDFGVMREWQDRQGIPRIEFATTEHRRRALSDLFHQHNDASPVLLHMARLQAENAYKSQREIELSARDIRQHLEHIEHGLHAHLHDGDETAETKATNAYYALLASATPMLTGLAKSKSWLHTEELVQEGLTCTTEAIMDLSGNEDLRAAAEGFYAICLSRASFKYSNFITGEVAANRSMGVKALRLELRIQEVQKRFAQEYGRVPSESEIYRKLDDPEISRKRVSNALARMQFGQAGTAHYDQYENLDRASILSATIDDQIERIYREDVAARVFENREITDKEKVMLSLYYGIFIEQLRGAEIRKTKNGPIFTYPHDVATFEQLTQQTVGNLRTLGSMLDYTHRGVGKILEVAREKAHADLERIVGDDTSF